MRTSFFALSLLLVAGCPVDRECAAACEREKDRAACVSECERGIEPQEEGPQLKDHERGLFDPLDSSEIHQ
jgi:hypothetical protein